MQIIITYHQGTGLKETCPLFMAGMLDGLSVDVLSEAENIDDMSMLDVKKYGIIVTSGSNEKISLKRFEVIRQ